ncbi:MAG: STAS domain-containing protein [Pseudomonadota bacterium]
MSHSLALPRELTIYTASETRTDWLTWLTTLPVDAIVDGSAVDQVDGAGLQLLVALRRAVLQRGHSWCLQSASATLNQACEVLGVAALLSASPAKGDAA